MLHTYRTYVAGSSLLSELGLLLLVGSDSEPVGLLDLNDGQTSE
jgi:hypothetical protein